MKPTYRRKLIWSRKQNAPQGNFGGPWLVIATTLLIFIITQAVALFIVEAGLAVTHSAHVDIAKLLDDSPPAQFLYVLIAEGLAILLVLAVLRGRGLKLAAIGLGRRPQKRDLTKGLIGFGCFYILLVITTVLLTYIFPDIKIDQQQDVGFNSLPTLLDGIVAFVALVILPPIGEETLVRGYLYSGLRASWRFGPALVVTSLLFALAHLQFGNSAGLVWGVALNTFVLSAVLVYLRENTGALYAGILVHGLNNVIAFSVHFHGAVF